MVKRFLAQSMRRRTGLPSILMLLLVAAIIATIAWSLVKGFERERALRAQVEATSASMSEFGNMQRGVFEAVTGAHGYALKGDPRYLRRYNAGRETTENALETMANLPGPAEAGDRAAKMRELRETIDTHFRMIEIAVQLAQQGSTEEAQSWIAATDDYDRMTSIVALTQELEGEEAALLARDITAVEASAARTRPILLALLGSLFLFFLIGSWYALRTLRAERRAQAASAERAAREAADLLANELNHRVKNMFAIVQSIVGSTLRAESDTAMAAQKVGQRIQALSVAHDVSQGASTMSINALSELIERTLAPYEQDNRAILIDGPRVHLPRNLVTPLGLIIHELATNAVKYGAWSVEEGGTVKISWSLKGSPEMLKLTWQESGGPAPEEPDQTGFGSRMISTAARQLKAEVDQNWLETGLEVVISFELPAEEDDQ
ncbi:HWE histidine kinase domain-containing protein [Sphingomicrobium marinum]|uniref:HWE histidine kinase domain-containing protein n=1 Tax=Sphingomicrobium marinum TaxID=1227950 RepID=UPI00224054B6|nr:HWE histidine kinase domain-containing protein [Sphingomicrobium marinum]